MVARRLGLVFKTHLVYASYNALGPNGSLQAYAFIKGEQYAMSNAAAQKMSDFDDGKPVSPFAFRLKKVAE